MMRRFYQVLSVLMVLIIFFNSSLNAEVSASQSGFFLNIAQNILNVFNISYQMDVLSFFIRKLAHFTQFFILGYLLLMGWKFKLIHLLIIILGVAITDELIQLTSDGRAFGVMDLLIDWVGGITGIFVGRKIMKQR